MKRSLPLFQIAICVPARNERELLPHLLDACGRLDLSGVTATLCLYLDGCTDDSAAVVARIAPTLPLAVVTEQGPVHPEANAGRARRAAMALGERVVGDDPSALLLSTDADSEPERGWVQAARRALDIADVAAGKVVRLHGNGDLNQTRLEHYYDRLHAHRRAIDAVPWDVPGGCHFGGGANLAIRAATYHALGGFRPLASGEDAALLDDASRAGWRVRRDPAMVVGTSSRRDGRAAGGLAASLAEMDTRGLPMVPHPDAADWQYRAQACARAAFGMLQHAALRDRLGATIGLTGDHVLGVARDSHNAEAFCMRLVPAAPGGEWLVPLAEAEEALARLEGLRCEAAA